MQVNYQVYVTLKLKGREMNRSVMKDQQPHDRGN